MKHTHKNQNGDVQIEYTTISKMAAFDLRIWGLKLAPYHWKHLCHGLTGMCMGGEVTHVGLFINNMLVSS